MTTNSTISIADQNGTLLLGPIAPQPLSITVTNSDGTQATTTVNLTAQAATSTSPVPSPSPSPTPTRLASATPPPSASPTPTHSPTPSPSHSGTPAPTPVISPGSGSTQTSKILGFQSFDGGTVGQTPGASNPNSAVSFNLNDGGNPNSAISKYSSAVSFKNSKTVMAQTLIKGQATPTWGCGWDYGLSKSQNGPLSAGDEIWLSMVVMFPPGFSFATNDGFLKWMRINTQSAAGSNVGYDDVLLASNGTYINNFEGNPKLNVLDTSGSHSPLLGVFETHDVYCKLGTNAATGIYRFWKNRQQIGADILFETLVNATDQSVMAFTGSTYWNGGNAANETVYMAMSAIAVNCKASGRNDQQYLGVDANGKSLIGLGF